MIKHSPFRSFKTSLEIIRLAVMLYVRFPLSLRNVEDLLHERAVGAGITRFATVAKYNPRMYRIIRCCDVIQFIFQRWRNPKWRHLSYHLEYDSLVRRWANEAALPRELSSVLSFTHEEPNNTSLPNHHSHCIV